MNWPGRVVLLVAIFVSVFLFWRKFGRALRIILAAKPDADFKLRPIGPRIRKVLWEVAAQGLVIAQRPLPGLAHAFVFWGFCVFALVTLNHFAAGFGHAFLSRDSSWGRGYFLIAGVFAVAVAISIAGLAFRRFVIRPKWLEPLSLESGLIAFLIFALMITYLATFLVAEGTAAGWVAWWAHALVILFFLPLIPSTKHMHLVLSPVTIFLERDGFSKIPPLVGDEDFGLVEGKDLTQIAALQAYSCVECGRCTEHCPANTTGKILNPKEIILGARHYLGEFGPKSSEPLLGKFLSMEAAFQCTTCGACEFQCPVGIQHLPMIIGLRRGAVNTGKWDNSHGSELFVTLERQGNALGFPPSDREKFIEKNGLPYFDGTQEYCLWMGCLGSFDPIATALYVKIDDMLLAEPGLAPWRPEGSMPLTVSDAELLAMAVMSALLGFRSERRWLRYAGARLTGLFPRQIGQSGYNKRLRKMIFLLMTVIRRLGTDTSLWSDDVWIVDSTPVQCGCSRETARRSDVAGWAQYGYCASHSRYFWGLRLHLVCTLHGLPVMFAVAGAKADEREVLLGMLEAYVDVVIGHPRADPDRGQELLRPGLRG